VPEFVSVDVEPELVDDGAAVPLFEVAPVDEPLGLVEPLVPGVVELPELMLPVAVLLVLAPEAPPELSVLPAELLPVEPVVPPVPCATTMPVPRARATAAASVNMRGCFLMMSFRLQVQGK
jgi:hypothetical protein